MIEPELHNYRFESISSLLKQGLLNDHYDEITPENYNQIYNGNMYKIQGQNELEILENIFCRFNTEVVPDFKGHSLLVSDVVVFNQHGKLNAYYVDSYGFTELPGFAKKLEKAGIHFELPEAETRKVKTPMISVRQRLEEKKKSVEASVASISRKPYTKEQGEKENLNPLLVRA